MVALRSPRQGLSERIFVPVGLADPFDTVGRPRRRDSLPENTRYVDSGCSLHPSCLTCPLVRCRYDEPGGMRQIVGRGRDAAILRARREERLTIEAIGRRYGVSRRTIFRVLARGRALGPVEGRGGGRPC